MRLLYLIADPFPTYRADVAVLFGKYLYGMGIKSDIVAQANSTGVENADWPAGKVILCPKKGAKFRDQFFWFFHDIQTLVNTKKGDYDAIMVRDKVFSAVVALLVASRLKIPFLYWMSFPMSETFIDIVETQGMRIGLSRYIYLFLKGHIGKFLLYRFILPRSAHIFVQSEKMRLDVQQLGIKYDKMTPVPMGIDPERIVEGDIPNDDARRKLSTGIVIAYLGTFDRMRKLDFLLDVLKELLQAQPDVKLLMIGDGPTPDCAEYLKEYAKRVGVAEQVIWTGWVTTDDAWRYMKYAHIAVSIFPRGYLLDSASPTKVVEYMALGIPTVANDQPDQAHVLNESGAGISVPMEVNEFVSALMKIMDNKELAASMSENGKKWVLAHRTYPKLAKIVKDSLFRFS